MCLSPLQAWLDLETVTESGKHPLLFKLPDSVTSSALAAGRIASRYREVALPCGKCWQCRKSWSYQIMIRAVMEGRLYDFNSFVTLTVSDSWLGYIFPFGVTHRPWQLFAKRLRKSIGPFRFLMCGEYGSESCRPHYHAIIFGHRFVDSFNTPLGYCPSRVLQTAWPYGNVQVSDVNDNRIAYVSGYTLKDYQLGRDNKWYDSRCLLRPYVKWSRNPGLGAQYYDKFYTNFITCQRKNNGNETKPIYGNSLVLGRSLVPFKNRYLSDRLHLLNPELSDKIKASNEDWLAGQSMAFQLVNIDELKRKTMCQMYQTRNKNRDLI